MPVKRPRRSESTENKSTEHPRHSPQRRRERSRLSEILTVVKQATKRVWTPTPTTGNDSGFTTTTKEVCSPSEEDDQNDGSSVHKYCMSCIR